MVAKVAGGIIGLGLIGTGGVAFVKPEWLGINRETIWKPLSQDKDFSTNVESGSKYNGKFGSDFRNYLVGLDQINKRWWNEKYESIKDSKPANSKFTSVDRGYGAEGTSLQKICGEAYEKADSDFEETNPDGTKFKKSEVWKYCSLVGTAPKKVSEKTDEEGSYTGENWIGKTKKEELLSIKHEDNQKLWELKNDEFFGTGAFTSNQKKSGPNDKFFKELFDKGNKDKYDLKNKCESAYKLDNTTSPANKDQVKEEDVVKYCSFKHK